VYTYTEGRALRIPPFSPLIAPGGGPLLLCWVQRSPLLPYLFNRCRGRPPGPDRLELLGPAVERRAGADTDAAGHGGGSL